MLKRLDLGGGTPQILARAPAGRGGAWHADGSIFFSPDQSSPVMKVAAGGGEVEEAMRLEPGQRSHRWPHLLPSGQGLLYYGRGNLFLQVPDREAPVLLTRADSDGVYLRSGWLLWVRRGTLVAQRLDLSGPALTGDPMTVVDGVHVENVSRSAVAVSASGTVAYRTDATGLRQLAWVDRSGASLGTLGPPDPNDLAADELEPRREEVEVQPMFKHW
jgi:hypothetical protein